MNNYSAVRLNLAVKPEFKQKFAEWQAQLHTKIVSRPGFVSLEIVAAAAENLDDWVIVQRFMNNEEAQAWSKSKEHTELLAQLRPLAVNEFSITEKIVPENRLEGGVTEVFVTQVKPEQEAAFKAWSARIHTAEAKFSGFIGLYVQSPVAKKGKNWITLLKFDSPENLDRWLASKERKEALKEAKELIASLESHRLISAYSGWFASIAKTEGLPPVWKQTMLVLLALFPIVMLEKIFLTPFTQSLNSSLAMFFANAISVTLISWPGMPMAIHLMRWWLKPHTTRKIDIAGVALLLLFYVVEIAIFWGR